MADIFDNFFGGTKSLPTSSSTQLPDWVEQSGKNLFGAGTEFAGRDFPAYPTDQRIAPFSEDQLAGFQATRENTGAWGPAYEAAFRGAGASAAPVGAEDIARYMNPYTDQVIDTTVNELGRQFNRDTIQRHGAMAMRGSFLNEDRRMAMDNLGREGLDRVIAETVARLKSGAFSDALDQANQERNRTASAAGMYSNLAPLRQNLGASDAAALQASGGAQQAQEQQKRTLNYDEFLKQFSYPQEQINWLLSLLRGTPYETSTMGTTPVATNNKAAQLAGAAAALFGAFG